MWYVTQGLNHLVINSFYFQKPYIWVSVHVYKRKTDSLFCGSKRHQPKWTEKTQQQFYRKMSHPFTFSHKIDTSKWKKKHIYALKQYVRVCVCVWELFFCFVFLQQCNSNLDRWWSFILSIYVCLSLKHSLFLIDKTSNLLTL